MGSQKKGKTGPSKKRRIVGAVVMKRRGAQARLKNALASQGERGRGDDRDTGDAPAVPDGEPKGLKNQLSRIKSKTKAFATKITKSSGSRAKAKKKRSR
ncbi:MAG TPA: hypothetical protein VKA13_08505 [Gammaproteobacteria bacterium]|nr:hypothetical protein [Gammaproteobacteria bacterium]